MKAMLKTVIIGVSIIFLGLIVFMIALALNGWKIRPKFSSEEFKAEGEINLLKIELDTGNLKTEFFDGERFEVVYPASSNYATKVEEKDGVLSVSGPDKTHWYSFSFGMWRLPDTVIKIPRSTVCALEVKVNAGEAVIASGSYGNCEVKVNAGSVKAQNIVCPSMSVEVNAGNFAAEKVTAQTLNCKVSAGGFKIDALDCPTAEVKVSAGSAEMKFVHPKEEYNISVNKSVGSCNIAGQTGSDPDKRLTVSLSAGSVTVYFA